MSAKRIAFLLASLASYQGIQSFAPTHNLAFLSQSTLSSTQLKQSADDAFEITVNMPPSDSGLQAKMKMKPLMDVPSEIIEVRYKLPFGLDVAPQNNLAVCTKDGAGGERVGDILRYTSCWSLGFPQGDGLVSSAASFAGGVSWQCSLFDVMKAAQWGEVVEALTSNVDSRTDEVLLIFERALPTEE